MKKLPKISQNFLVTAALALVLSGCSIVVFEDGPDCPATMECPVAAIPSIDAPDQPTPAQSDQTELAETEADARQPLSDPLMTPPLIDGYVTNFAYDSAELGSQAIDDLKAIAVFLVDNGDIALVIEGHCDERGSRDYNLALGARRAIAMRDVLTANGLDADRIKTVSYGKERPIIVGSTPEAWARNRRAVIRQQAR
jgi:peptidoglycan-associated lipoprotein